MEFEIAAEPALISMRLLMKALQSWKDQKTFYEAVPTVALQNLCKELKLPDNVSDAQVKLKRKIDNFVRGKRLQKLRQIRHQWFENRDTEIMQETLNSSRERPPSAVVEVLPTKELEHVETVFYSEEAATPLRCLAALEALIKIEHTSLKPRYEP